MTKTSQFAERPSNRTKTVAFRAVSGCSDCPLRMESSCQHPGADHELKLTSSLDGVADGGPHELCPLKRDDLQLGLRWSPPKESA